MLNYQCMNCMGVYDSEIEGSCPHCGYDKDSSADIGNALPAGTSLVDRYIVGNRIKESDNMLTYIGWDNLSKSKITVKEYFLKSLCERDKESDAVKVQSGAKGKFERGMEIFLEKGEEFRLVSEQVPSLIEVFDCFVENSTAYIITEYIEGKSVKEVVGGGKIDFESMSTMIKPAISAIGQLHGLGLSVQNISSENIIITADKRIKITDFDCKNDKKVVSVNIEKNPCSAPEMYRSGSPVTSACDVYSMAAVIYKALTGRDVPFAQERVKEDTLIPPCKLADIDKNTENAILNALEPDVANRTQDGQSFFDEMFSGNRVERRVPGADGNKNKKKNGLLAAVAAVLVLAVIGVFLLPSIFSKPEQNTVVATVPYLCDLSFNQAKIEIDRLCESIGEEYGVVLTVVKSEETVSVDEISLEGKVAEQIPEAGAEIFASAGTKEIEVKLYSYTEPEPPKIKVPDVVGKSADEAVKILTEAGFATESIKTEKDKKYSKKVEKGKVSAQSLESGTEAELNSEIVIYISKGAAPETTVPTTKKPQITTTRPVRPSVKPSVNSEEVNENIDNAQDELF